MQSPLVQHVGPTVEGLSATSITSNFCNGGHAREYRAMCPTSAAPLLTQAYEIGEFTHEFLAADVRRKFTARDLMLTLQNLLTVGGRVHAERWNQQHLITHRESSPPSKARLRLCECE